MKSDVTKTLLLIFLGVKLVVRMIRSIDTAQNIETMIKCEKCLKTVRGQACAVGWNGDGMSSDVPRESSTLGEGTGEDRHADLSVRVYVWNLSSIKEGCHSSPALKTKRIRTQRSACGRKHADKGPQRPPAVRGQSGPGDRNRNSRASRIFRGSREGQGCEATVEASVNRGPERGRGKLAAKSQKF